MSEQVTLQVSEQVLRQAAQIAAHTRQSVEDVLADWLESAATELPVQTLSDEEVLALTRLQFTPEEQESFSELLERNRENQLDAEGRQELNRLMKIYERGLLRKAQALQEAVARGLIEPLKP
jgi:pyruvate-formate lyase